ncbi:hypothetical protein ES703_123174 [subsurface metagenome]
MSLYFQVEIAKCLLIPQSSLFCLIKSSFQNEAGNLAAGTGGEGDKALVMLPQELFIHPRSVVEAIELCPGSELD